MSLKLKIRDLFDKKYSHDDDDNSDYTKDYNHIYMGFGDLSILLKFFEDIGINISIPIINEYMVVDDGIVIGLINGEQYIFEIDK